MEQEDAQVIAQLKKKRARLYLELEAVELAIRALVGLDEDNLDPLDVIRFDNDIQDDTAQDELAIVTLMYRPNDTYDKKIQYVLRQIGQGSAKQITEYIIKIDRDIKDAQKLYESITYRASRMYKEGKLLIYKSGKKNVYKIKKTV